MEEKKEQERTDPAKELYSILHDFVWILAVISVLFVFFVRVVGVDGSSMFSTLVDHDYLLLRSNFTAPEYVHGDIVVLRKDSFSDKMPLVKRVIATEGETVDIDFETGTVSVDGQILTEPYIAEPTYLDYGDGVTFPVTVPEGCLFVMGDNRNHSADSRYGRIGMIDTRSVLGRVFFLLFPGNQTDINGRVIAKRDFSRIGVVK